MLGLEDVVLDVRVEAVLVELIEIGRVENGHVDVTGAEQIVDHHLRAVATEFVERPYRLGWAETAVIGIETLGPALSVFVAPVLWIGVPQMGVAVDDEDVLSIMLVHKGPLRLADWISREYRRGAWPAWLVRTNHWPPAKHAPYGRPGSVAPVAPQTASCRRRRRSRGRCRRNQGRARRGGR